MTRTRVYVSSTFEDLKDYRARVNEGLRRAGYELVAMEDYPAFDQRPLAKCLADVAACDLYVGILAKRYGYVPDQDNPQGLSITEREYRQATESGLPRLVFQLDPKIPWQEQFDDRLQDGGDHGAQLRRFREEVGKAHGNRFFSTPDELARLVLEAVSAWEKDHARARPPAPAQPKAAPPYLIPEPSRDHDIIGREDLLETLWADIAQGRDCSLVFLAGVGKTAVALELVRQRARILGQFEGVLWADLGKRPERLEQLRRWAVALGVAPERMSNLASIEDWKLVVKGAIGQRRLLLVLDDVWSEQDAREFAGLGPACVTLVTTRLRQVAAALSRQDQVKGVDVLDEAGSLALLSQMAPHAVEADRQSAREMAEAVQGLPLALVLMGKFLRRESGDRDPDRIAAAFDTLRQAGKRLRVRVDSLGAGGDERTLEEIIDVSYEALPTDEARAALEKLAIFRPKPHAFSKAMAREICGTRAELLFQLADMGLVDHAGKGDYTMHRVIAEYARNKLPPAAARTLHRKALAWYRARLEAMVEDDLSAYLGWFVYEKTEWQALKDAWLYHLAAAGDATGSTLAFLRVYFDAFWWWGYYQRFPFCERLIREWQQRDIGSAQREALGQLALFQRHYPAGHDKRGTPEDWRRVEASLTALRQGQGLDGEAARIKGADARRVRHFTDFFLAECAGYGRGQRDEAVARYIAVHHQFAQDRAPWEAAWVWFYLAQYLLDGADPGGADGYARQALAEAREDQVLGKRDPELLANIYRQLGDLAVAAGDLATAGQQYRRAACYAFIFQAVPEPADRYTVRFYREISGRISRQVAACQAASRQAGRGLAAALHDVWAAWWARHPAPGADLEQALTAADPAALEACLFPPVPSEDAVIAEAADLARAVNAVLPALRAAAGIAADPASAPPVTNR